MEGSTNVRPAMKETYFPPRHLHPNCQHLNRTALIYMIAGEPTYEVHVAIPRVVQQECRWKVVVRQHIKTYTTRITPYLVIMPWSNMRDEVIANSPYEIPELQTEFGAIARSP
jgi:hypothetical protein